MSIRNTCRVDEHLIDDLRHHKWLVLAVSNTDDIPIRSNDWIIGHDVAQEQGSEV